MAAKVTLQPILAGTLFVSLAFVVAMLMLPGRVAAQTEFFSATLSGAAEVPSVSSDAGGSFKATLSDGTLNFTLTSDAMGITQAHIHMGAADANGGVVAFLFGMEADGVDGIDVSGSIGADDVIGDIAGDFDALIAALLAGEGYINVHTLTYPPGEVRGLIGLSIATPPVPEQISEPEPEATSMPDGLPNAGGGGLAADKDSATWVAIGLASGLAGLVVLGSVSARVAVRRRR